MSYFDDPSVIAEFLSRVGVRSSQPSTALQPPSTPQHNHTTSYTKTPPEMYEGAATEVPLRAAEPIPIRIQPVRQPTVPTPSHLGFKSALIQTPSQSIDPFLSEEGDTENSLLETIAVNNAATAAAAVNSTTLYSKSNRTSEPANPGPDASPQVSRVKAPPPTPQVLPPGDPIMRKPESPVHSLDRHELAQNVLECLAEASPYGLQESIHAAADVQDYIPHDRSFFDNILAQNKPGLSQSRYFTAPSRTTASNRFSVLASAQQDLQSSFKYDDTAKFMAAVHEKTPVRSEEKPAFHFTFTAGTDQPFEQATVEDDTVKEHDEHEQDTPTSLDVEEVPTPGGGSVEAEGDNIQSWLENASPTDDKAGSSPSVDDEPVVTDAKFEQHVPLSPPKSSVHPEEDRENLQRFTTWGTPEPRDRPTARVRKVILTNLPSTADATMVQSLIFGGMIDQFHISGGSAYVSFCDPDDCEKYFVKHSRINGLLFRRDGRQYIIRVSKARDVEPISSQLSTQLECGASRCVKAVGANEDLRIGALHRMAAEKHRKVEKVLDSYSGTTETRTVIFRFTNIGDAVNFKAQLTREDDWEHCNIQFTADPCKAATEIHWD